MKFVNTNDSRDNYEVPATAELNKLAKENIAWVSLQEHEMDKFMVDVLPELLGMHYSDESAHIVEKWLLEKAPDIKALKNSKDGQEAYFWAVRYFAEVLCQRFEAEWIVAATENKLISIKPRVLLPFGVALSIFEYVENMVKTHHSTSFSKGILVPANRRYKQWVADGRPQVNTPLGGKRPVLPPLPKAVQEIIDSWKKS